MWPRQLRLRNSDVLVYVLIRVEAAVSERMVEHGFFRLQACGRHAHDVEQRHTLCERSGHAIYGGELADAEGREEDSEGMLDSRVSVAGVRSIELKDILM